MKRLASWSIAAGAAALLHCTGSADLAGGWAPASTAARDAGAGGSQPGSTDARDAGAGGSVADPADRLDAGAGADAAPEAGPSPDPGAAAPVPVPGLAAVWAVNDGEKVEKDDLAHPDRAGSSVWREGVVSLVAAGNEMLSFQLVVEADREGLHGLDVRLPRLQKRDGEAAIVYTPPGDDPTDFVARPIQIFSEHYMLVTEPSQARWVFGSSATPEDPTGWKPVQLVPENARPGRGGLPMAVAPGTNQAFWFDVYVPRGLPAGHYDGELELSAGGGAARVPVELEVLGFDLPDDNSLTAMLYFEPDQVTQYQGRPLTERFHRLARRNRVELVGAYDLTSLQAARGRFDGSDFTSAHGYEGPGAGRGARIAPASFYGPGSAYDERAGAWQTSDAWITALGAIAPGAATFLYMPDEPAASEYARIWTIADNIRSNPGPGRRLPIFVTRSYTSGLDGAIDIWCSGAASFDVARAQTERAKGRRYWFYNGTRPATGAVTIDSPATDPRVNAWAAFKHGVDVYFYWHSNHWRHNGQKQGERNQDVWSNPITFDNRGQPNKPLADQGFIHGDGVLLYPGQELLHPEQDRGISGPVSTIQLANLRRGVQDHLYLSLASQLGLDGAVAAALNATVPAVFSDAGSGVRFAQRGEVFERARRDLARAIAAKLRW
jgi:hypothetical protein